MLRGNKNKTRYFNIIVLHVGRNIATWQILAGENYIKLMAKI
jgi:hypothetical protein